MPTEPSIAVIWQRNHDLFSQGRIDSPATNKVLDNLLYQEKYCIW